MRANASDGEALDVAITWRPALRPAMLFLSQFWIALLRQAVVRKGEARPNLQMSVSEVLDEVTSILSKKHLVF